MARSPRIRRPRPPVRRATAARSTVALAAENFDRRPSGQGMARDIARPPGLAPVAPLAPVPAPVPEPPAPEAQTDANENAVTERIGPLATGAVDGAMGDTTAEASGAITGAILEGVSDLAGAPEETEVSETGAAQAAVDTGAVTNDVVAVEVDESTEAPTPEGMPAEGEAAVTEGEVETSEEPAPEPSPAAAVGPATRAVTKCATASASHQPEATATGAAMASSNRPAVTQRRAASAAGAAMADEAETGEVNRQSFRSQLREAIDKAMKPPESEREAKRLMDEGGKDAARDVQGALGGHTAEATGALPAAVDESAQPSPESMDGGEEVALEPEAIGEPPSPVSAAPVVAPPSTPQAVDMSGNREDADALAAENNITETQLERGNEPEFDATLGARSEAEAHSEEGPAQLREAEAADRAGQRETASGAVATGLSDFHAERATRLTNVATQQAESSGLSATRKSEITAELEAIGVRTRADVTDILTKMNDSVVEDFEQAITEALSDYNEVFEDVRGGFLSQLFDFGDVKFERALRAGRAAFQSRIDRAIDEIATYVEGELARARLRVEEGRTEIDRYINEELPEDEREFAEDASTSITEDFDALEGEIESSRDALVQRMVTMYRDGVERRNAREEELRLANRSLWERVYDATVGVIQKVIEFKNMLLGILARAAAVVEAIIQDPIQFLSNLIAGIKAGLERFMGNIVENLKQALMSWLFGAIEGAGIQLPDTFDLKGFLSIVLQVLGLTKENVRARAVNILGEEMVSRIETGVEMIRILFTEGPAGLWQMLLEKLGDIKETILAEVRSWVISQIIEAGIKWILGLLNPAGAFVKACMMIYDIVVFFIERGQQIIEAVNAIIKALGTIVAGNISAMAQAVEGALNRILPVVIGFLASLLGLGGISDAIRGFIEKVQRPVNKVIDWVINKGVELARGIAGFFGGGQQEEEEEGDGVDPNDLTPEQRLARAEEQLPAKVNNEIDDGISTPALERKLSTWRDEYGLRELVIVNGEVIARVNPESRIATATPANKARLGELLEQVLIAAEQGFLREHDENISPELRAREDRAVAASVANERGFHELPRVSRIRIMRRIQSGNIQLQPPTGTWGVRPHPLLQLGTQGSSQYQNDPTRLAMARQLGVGSYEDDQDLFDTRAEDDLDAARAGLQTAGRRNLFRAVEPARAQGGLAGRMIAEGLVDARVDDQEARAAYQEEIDLNELAPMAADMSSVAAERDAGLIDDDDIPAQNRDAVNEAIGIRRDRIANIFSRLETVVENPETEDLLASDAALSELADEFRSWLDVHFPEPDDTTDEEALEAATDTLVEKIVRFMHAMGDE